MNQETRAIRQEQEAQVAHEINAFLKKIDGWATLLQTATVIISAISIITSLIVGFFVVELPPYIIKIIALIAALFSILASAFKLEKKAHDMREAYRYLQYSLYQYKIGQHDINQLVASYLETEKLIGHVELDELSMPKIAELRQGSK